jgi:acyl carrier protein
MKKIESAICEFLLELPTARKIRKLKPGDSLFQRGLLDSQAVINMVAFCEETFDIEIFDEDVVPENFESVRALSRLIKRAQSRQVREG